MENGDQVSKLGYLCPQNIGGEGINPNNPPPIYTPLVACPIYIISLKGFV